VNPSFAARRIRTDPIRRPDVASQEHDRADHRSVAFDHEIARVPPGHLRRLALEFVTLPMAADVPAHLGRREQLDERRAVPGL
jgi:hypothetical protein